jgi:hypothetical protein
VQDGRLLGVTGKHLKSITCLDTTVDASAFLTGSASGAARLWSAQDATPASPLFDHPLIDVELRNEVVSGVVAPNGRWVATLSGQVRPQASAAVVQAWDSLTGEMLFARSLGHIQSRFPPLDPAGPLRVVLILFSPDSQLLHVLGTSGLLSTIDLAPTSDTLEAMQSELAIRTGVRFDGFGGVKILDPSELDELWQKRKARE